MSEALRIDNITCKYGEQTIIENVTCNIKPNTFTAILGANGAGKTTLLKTITGTLAPHQGHIYINGKEIRRLPKKTLARKMAVVAQQTIATFEFTVEQVVMMGRNPYMQRLKSATQNDIKKIYEAMEATNVLPFAKKKITELSGGECQRVFIARALAQEPDVIILDEPVSNLDLKQQCNILNKLKALSKTMTVIVVLHDINAAMQYADYILMLKQQEYLGYQRVEDITAEQMEQLYDIKIEPLQKKTGEQFFIVKN